MAYENRESKSKDHWAVLRREAIAKHKRGNCLTLEETALAIWNPLTERRPMTCMGVLKIEKRALAKLKEQLGKYGINSLSDVFETKYREIGGKQMLEN